MVSRSRSSGARREGSSTVAGAGRHGEVLRVRTMAGVTVRGPDCLYVTAGARRVDEDGPRPEPAGTASSGWRWVVDDLDRVRRGSDATVLGVPDEPTTTVLEAMPVGYLSLDADWRISYVIAEGERTAGAARQDLLGCSFWMAFPATVGTVFKDSYRRARAEQVDVTARHRAYQARDLAARRLQRIAHFALAVNQTQAIEELARTVAEDGLPELGCNGGAVAVLDPADPRTLLGRRGWARRRAGAFSPRRHGRTARRWRSQLGGPVADEQCGGVGGRGRSLHRRRTQAPTTRG